MEMNVKVIRQYECAGYYIDGYIPEKKLAIEVDEIPKTSDKQIRREAIITERLGCAFMRIKDY